MRILIFFASAVAAAAALPVAETSRSSIDFSHDVYPILKRNCLACHNTTTTKAGLNLESPATMMSGGDSGPAIVAGRSHESLIFKTAAHLEDPLMPPAGNKVNAVNFTAEELGLLKAWIDQGATGQGGAVTTPIVWRGLAGRTAPVTALAISPGGVVVAAARGNQVELHELATGRSLGLLADPGLASDEVYGGQSVADRDVVMAAAFATDDLMATGGYRSVRIWRRAAFRPVHEALEITETATAVAASGVWAAAGEANGRVVVWDVSAATPQVIDLKDSDDHGVAVTAVALSPDGAFVVAATDDRKMRFWSVAAERVVYHAVLPDPVTRMMFVQAGQRLVVAGADGHLAVYAFSPPPQETPPTVPTPERELQLADRAPAVLCALDPAGTHILWGDGGSELHVVDVATGETVRKVILDHPQARERAHAARQVEAARNHADGRQARATAAVEAAEKEREAARAAHEVMEKARAEWQRKHAATTAAAESLRSRPDDPGRQEIAAKAAKDAQAAERDFLNAHTNAELGVRLAGDAMQKRVAADAAQAAAATALTEAQSSLETTAATSPFPAITAAAVLNDHRTLVIAVEGGWTQWHCLVSGTLLDRAESPAPPTSWVAVDSLGWLLAIQPDKSIASLPARRPWLLERTLGSIDDPTTFRDRVTAVAFSSDARLLATGGGIPSRDGEVKLWHVDDGTLALDITHPHSDTVNAVAFSPDDSTLATAGSDRWARIFRVADGAPLAAMEGHAAHVLGVDWRSDGLALATSGADKSLRTWDPLEARQIGNNTSFAKQVSAVRWLGTSHLIASASGDTTVRLNDHHLPGTAGFATALATDSLGQWIAAGGEDGAVRVWRTNDRSLAWEFQPAPATNRPRK